MNYKFKSVIVDDDNVCYWERAWKRLYNLSCDFAKSKGQLTEFLEQLDTGDESE